MTAADQVLAHAFGQRYELPIPLLGYLLANAPGLGMAIATDSVRRGPAELIQAMLTLADLTGWELDTIRDNMELQANWTRRGERFDEVKWWEGLWKN